MGGRAQRRGSRLPPGRLAARPLRRGRGGVPGGRASRGGGGAEGSQTCAGRPASPVPSAAPVCRVLTKQSAHTAPSLLLSEVRDVVVFFPSSLPFPSPFSESSSQAAAYNAGS